MIVVSLCWSSQHHSNRETGRAIYQSCVQSRYIQFSQTSQVVVDDDEIKKILLHLIATSVFGHGERVAVPEKLLI